MVDSAWLDKVFTNDGNTILNLSREKPVMLVFLRHFGCVFCREAMHDLAQLQSYLKQRSITLVFVHMADPELAESYFDRYGFENIQAVSDPETTIYQKFGLYKGNFRQIFGLKTWLRTAKVGVAKGIKISRKQIGDGFQMPGIFMISDGAIRDQFIHRTVADVPDYKALVERSIALPD